MPTTDDGGTCRMVAIEGWYEWGDDEYPGTYYMCGAEGCGYEGYDLIKVGGRCPGCGGRVVGFDDPLEGWQ